MSQDENLLNEIDVYLQSRRQQDELIRFDNEVAEAVTPEEYSRYVRFKQFCLHQLAKQNRTPGENGALTSAIEQGFVLGYWFGMQNRNSK